MSSDPIRFEPPSRPGDEGERAHDDDGGLRLWAALQEQHEPAPGQSARLAEQRRRLAERVAASARANRCMVTTRHAPAAMSRANDVARLQTLYLAAEGPLRPGEPLNVLLIELAPDGVLPIEAPADGVQREWLLLRGAVELKSADHAVTLAPLDFHLEPAALTDCAGDAAIAQLEADAAGALLFLRESLTFPEPGAAPRTVRDADTPWEPFAPRIERRLLWQSGATLGAVLLRAEAGARVPHHAHRHDEECLVLRGETFQDDCLLREGDYQLAPAGSEHKSVMTDVGGVFFIHGDLHLDLVVPPGPAA